MIYLAPIMTAPLTPPCLPGQSIFLRPLSDADVSDSYIGWLNDPEVGRFLETRYSHHDRASVLNFVRAMNTSGVEFLFGIFLAADGRHVGNIKVGPIKWPHPVADVSLLIGDRSVWGRGVATEAIGLISRWAFKDLAVRKLSAGLYAPNEGSRRAFLKAGYQQEGLRRRHYLLDGTMCDLVEMGLCPEDLSVE